MTLLWSFESRRSSIHSSRSSLTNPNSDPNLVVDHTNNHHNNSHSNDSSDSYNMAEFPFAQPELLVPRPLPMPLAGITKLRDRLSFKHARAALAEREILKRENRCKRPLTERNVDTFLIEQDLHDARIRRADDLHVSQWLQQLP
ncbi:hypothetical protein PISL3812_02100 [Talaromyces islandicus]|uniref:Uncharacterized protein n=1 Tax=Talaromyces islandicus TaxID=28573 RepID=A0A0U1LNY6_TALIS|nr:hypothetical protein PISL3812_02100 [Talaromyces islandicus]